MRKSKINFKAVYCSSVTRIFPVLLFSFFTLNFPFAADVDFALALNQDASYGSKDAFEYRAGIIPGFTLLFGETGAFHVSAGLTLGYGGGFYFAPELLHTEFSISFGGFGIKAGRINYSDPLNFTAEGLFDGLQLTHSSSAGIFGFGAWYTGLLYKRNINILMTQQDKDIYATPLNYSNFAGTYFAPRRILTSIDWEHKSVFESIGMKIALMAQFDLNGGGEKLHTQYLNFKADVPVNALLFELGGGFQAARLEEPGNVSYNLAFAGMFSFSWTMPFSFSSRLSFTARYASGKMNNDLAGAFIPVTAKRYGYVFTPEMTALTALSVNYSARIPGQLGISADTAYYIRNDLVTQNSFNIAGPEKGGHFLGAEIYARLVWNPFSDLQLSLGSGAFFPALGNNWDEPAIWKIELSAVLSVY